MQVAHDNQGNTTVSDLTLVDVSQPEAVSSLLERAMEKRAVGCTALNEQSSRSHMVGRLERRGRRLEQGSITPSGLLAWISRTACCGAGMQRHMLRHQAYVPAAREQALQA